MPDREDVEIHLQLSADLSGAERARRELQDLREAQRSLSQGQGAGPQGAGNEPRAPQLGTTQQAPQQNRAFTGSTPYIPGSVENATLSEMRTLLKSLNETFRIRPQFRGLGTPEGFQLGNTSLPERFRTGLEVARGYLQAPSAVVQNLQREKIPTFLTPSIAPAQLGLAEGKGQVLGLFNAMRGISIASGMEDVAGTASHEATHAWDFWRGGATPDRIRTRVSENPELSDLYRQAREAGQLPTEYARTNPQEGMAEVVRSATAMAPADTDWGKVPTPLLSAIAGKLQSTQTGNTPGPELKKNLIGRAGLEKYLDPNYISEILTRARGEYGDVPISPAVKALRDIRMQAPEMPQQPSDLPVRAQPPAYTRQQIEQAGGQYVSPRELVEDVAAGRNTPQASGFGPRQQPVFIGRRGEVIRVPDHEPFGEQLTGQSLGIDTPGVEGQDLLSRFKKSRSAEMPEGLLLDDLEKAGLLRGIVTPNRTYAEVRGTPTEAQLNALRGIAGQQRRLGEAPEFQAEIMDRRRKGLSPGDIAWNWGDEGTAGSVDELEKRLRRRGRLQPTPEPEQPSRLGEGVSPAVAALKSIQGRVPDEPQQPSTYYHGTNADFERVDPNKVSRAWNRGYNLTQAPELAEAFAQGEGGNIRPVQVPQNFRYASPRELARAGGRAEPLIEQGYHGVDLSGGSRETVSVFSQFLGDLRNSLTGKPEGISPAVAALKSIQGRAPDEPQQPSEQFQKEIASGFRRAGQSAQDANAFAQLFVDRLKAQGTYEKEIAEYQRYLAQVAAPPPPPTKPPVTVTPTGEPKPEPEGARPSTTFATLLGARERERRRQETLQGEPERGVTRFARTTEEAEREKARVDQEFYRNQARQAKPEREGPTYDDRRRQQATYQEAFQRAARERRVSPYGPQGPEGPPLLPKFEAQVPQVLQNQMQAQERDLLRRFGPGARQQQAEVKQAQNLFGRLQNVFARQGTTEEVPPEEDPRRQAQLYQMRAKQQRDYDAALRRAARERRITPEGPQGPEGPPTPPNVPPNAPEGTGGRGGGITPIGAARFVAASVGLGFGLSVYYLAGKAVHDILAEIVTTEEKAIQSTRDLTAEYGTGAQQLQNFSKQVAGGIGTGAGVFRLSDVEAVITGLRPLQENLRLSDQQMRSLVVDAAKLADLRSIPLADATNALGQALQGSSEAAGKLGLSLSNVQVASQYANGQFSSTFDLLTNSQKAEATLAVATQQIADQQRNLGTQSETLSEALRGLSASWEGLLKSFGTGPIDAATSALDGLRNTLAVLQRDIDEAKKNLPGAAVGVGEKILVPGSEPQTANLDVPKAVGNVFDRVGNFLNKAANPQAVPQEGGGYGTAAFAGQEPQKEVQQAVQDLGKAVTQPTQIEAPAVAPQSLAKLQDLKEGMDQYSRAAASAKAVSDVMFSKLAEDIPAIQRQLSSLTGAVQNVSALTGTQVGAVAQRQALIAIQKQRELAAPPPLPAYANQLPGLQQLTNAYSNLLTIQQRRNVLEYESIQLAAQEAQAVEGQLAAQYRLEDLQRAQNLARLTAQDIFLPAAQRGAALVESYRLRLQQPGVERAALQAQAPVIAAQRQEQANQLLQRIAQATEAAQQRAIDLTISGNVDVNLKGTGAATVPADQADRVAGILYKNTQAAFSQARKAAENTAPASVAGGGTGRGY